MVSLDDEQIRLEEDTTLRARQKIDSAFIHIIESGGLTETSFGQTLLRASINNVVKGIISFFTSVHLRGESRKYKDKLKAFYEGREDVLAYILLNSMLARVALEPRGVVNLSTQLLKDINLLLNLEKHRKQDPKLYAYMEYEFKGRGKKYIEGRKKKIAKLRGFDTHQIEPTIKLGTTLIKLVLSSGNNLFQVITGATERKKINTRIALSDDAMKLIGKHRDTLINNVFTYPPLVTRPTRPLSVYHTGGYKRLDNITLVKTNKKHLDMIADDIDMNGRFIDILDKVQSVGWQINTRVLSIMHQIIEDNLVDPSSSAGNPKLYGGIPYMDHLDAEDIIKKVHYGKLKEDGHFEDMDDYRRWYRDYSDQKALIESIKGRRMGYLFALDVAKRFSKYEEFFYSYQFDYRFRMYPIQQHLNPQNTGNLKALLQFSKGQVLNKEGLKWFKIHGANCYGEDKAPYSERIALIEGMEEEIKGIASDPLSTLDRWAHTDSPFEFLAFCFAYSDYLHDTDAIIHIPVALDATCSGIQIYSGLLRDADGAKAVNVIGDTRNDIYMDVATVSNRLLEEGSYPQTITFTTSDGVETTVNTQIEAHSLRGKINRRLTKRNVMTTPYSVTDRGMFDQIKELLDEDEADGNIWWAGDKWIVAKLVTALNIQAIAEVVQGATQGQHYIKELTRKITKENKSLKWKSPIYDLPMLQRITRFVERRLVTELGKLTINKPTDNIHKQKMLSSIAPNFIHQMDAVLMYRTIEKCLEDGVGNYWLIHDSYGVSPNDAEILSKNVREAYKEIFEMDILKEWTQQIGLEWDDRIMINTLNLDDVLTSEYIFS